MYDVIYEAEIALCNINKQPLQLVHIDFERCIHHLYCISKTK